MSIRRSLALLICPSLGQVSNSQVGQVFFEPASGLTEHDILKLGNDYAAHLGVAISTLGKNVADDGRFFLKLADGHTITLRRANALVKWFSENWPADLAWPRAIIRPTTKKEAA